MSVIEHLNNQLKDVHDYICARWNDICGYEIVFETSISENDGTNWNNKSCYQLPCKDSDILNMDKSDLLKYIDSIF